MTTNHLDQLAEWWETAEQGAHKPGDTIIIDLGDDGYRIDTASTSWVYWGRYGDTRILARAPKPKPAWHDAVAVTATATDELGDEITAVWVREGDELWRSDEGGMVLRDDLRDVTPLIEAKVTDEMVLAALQARSTYFGNEPAKRLDNYTSDVAEYTRAMLTAALGLEAT